MLTFYSVKCSLLRASHEARLSVFDSPTRSLPLMPLNPIDEEYVPFVRHWADVEFPRH